MARHFFLTADQISGDQVVFSATDSHHLTSLRKKLGDRVEGIIEQENKTLRYVIEITFAQKVYIGKIVSRQEEESKEQVKIHILQCIAKGEKMDWVIQKACELQTTTIYPLYSEFGDIKTEIGVNKLTRWNTIAREASIQSGRLSISIVHSPISLDDFFEQFWKEKILSENLGISLYEGEEKQTLHDIEENIKNSTVKNIYILIGPEGGLSKKEVLLAQEHGFHTVGLGKTILRTETASIVALSIIQFIRDVI